MRAVSLVGSRGGFSIPKAVRQTLDIAPGDPVEIYVEGEAIILQKREPVCVFCGQNDGGKMMTVKDNTVCQACCREARKEFR